MGLGVLDSSGEEIGHVVDTWPDDGGWEVELVVVRLFRFGERRMLPVTPDGGVHRAEDPYRAISYWQFEERADGGKVTALWRRSSGSFATERPFRTSPSRTPIAS